MRKTQSSDSNPQVVSSGKETSEYLRKHQLAIRLGVSARTITNLMARRVVPFRRLGRRLVLFRIQEVEKALDRFRVAAVGEEVGR